LRRKAGVWGGAGNVVVPLTKDIGDSELFWALAGRCDPELIGVHVGDFALFYALRAWAQVALWLPLTLESDLVFVDALTAATRTLARTLGGGGRAAIVSASAMDRGESTRDALTDIRFGPNIDVTVSDWRSVLPPAPIRLAERDRPGRVQPVLFHRGVTPPLDTPVPRTVETDDPQAIHWAWDVAVDGWTPVRHPALGDALLEPSGHFSGHVRSTREGVSYFGQRPLAMAGEPLEAMAVRRRFSRSLSWIKLEIVLPNARTCRPSDKGVFASESIRMLGGFDAFCRLFRVEAVRAIFDAFRSSSPVGLHLKDRRTYVTFAEIEQVAPGARVVETLATLEAAFCRHSGDRT
jgi:hypothetical protein